MKKQILGLDLGTNSIGWALVKQDFEQKQGEITGLGSRIIPMSQETLGKFGRGDTKSQTAERTKHRGASRLYQRDNLRRERLHRVLNILGFLPNHYKESIDFEKRVGQFKPETEVKLPYRKDAEGSHHFIFQESFNEMADEFKKITPDIKLPYDWTIYYLRKKALSEKVSKQELAWILLNFNQKRGYYQLRGEGEEEADSKDKLKEYHSLIVSEVEATQDTNSKGTWYNIILENGWVYRRQSKEPLLDWKGKTREFMVTTTLEKDGTVKKDRDGNEKRSFKAVDSKKDWIAIKKKTEKDLAEAETTVGVYIYETLLRNPNQKIRGKLIKTIEREYYRKELRAILDKQIKEHPELQNDALYKRCINELYRYNEAHKREIKDKGFGYLFLEDIIFYQRPLKSQKSTIANCSYEFSTYKDENKKQIEKYLKATAKSNPLYQEFRLWQFLKNLKIYQKEKIVDQKTIFDQDVTKDFLTNESEWVDLFDFLNDKKEIDQKSLIGYFVNRKLIRKVDKKNYRWNYVEDKKDPCNETRAEFIKRLSKIKDFNWAKILTKDFEKELWHIIYSVKDKIQYVKALKTFAEKKGIDEAQFRKNFEKFNPYDSAYGAYSEKALKKLLPLMRRGKYWDKDAISDTVKDRIQTITDRVRSVDFDLGKINDFADDDIPKQLLKSFAETKDALKGLNTYQACYAVYDRHSEVGKVQYWRSPEDITKYLDSFKQHSLRNPIVEQVVIETLKVVRDIWEYYGKGKKDFFNEIHVELAREMKNDKKTREKMSKSITKNENTNERIKNILKELSNDTALQGNINPYSKAHQDILKLYEEGVFAKAPEIYKKIKLDDINKIRENNSPSKSDIRTYKLWMEQGYISPYTGKTIPLSQLFTTAYEIDHIIPSSRYFDDSMGNKIICESAVNREKDNKTAYEFIKQNPGRIINLGQGKQVKLFTLDAYENHCKTYFKGNAKKLKFLLSEDIPEGFINRQLNDTRYISKVVKGLLSNIVREEGEKEVTSKNVVPLASAITGKLKKDWGLQAVWEDIITPRFERMNKLSDSGNFRKEVKDDSGNKYCINTVPDEIQKGFTKKRIDHRHHALDALVIACVTKGHINYITSLNTKRKNIDIVSKFREIKKETIINKNTGKSKTSNVAKNYHKPWSDFTKEAFEQLSKTVVSFKQNQRIINKTTNKTWRWEKDEKNGSMKKVLKKQEKQSWAIRKPMHKETVYGKVDMPAPKGKIVTAVRTPLSDITTRKKLKKITDASIRKILNNHLENYRDDRGVEQFDRAFSQDGIAQMNANIQMLNEGKPHQPIYKVRVYEVGVKFPVGNKGNKALKYVEAAQGTNLFFAIYRDEKKQERAYKTIPLNEVIAHQKQAALLPKRERSQVPIDAGKGRFLFSLSPNDLVYVPTDEEIENRCLVDFKRLNKEQLNRIYKMVSTTEDKAMFRQVNMAKLIKTYTKKDKFGELGSQNKMVETMCDKKYNIAARCWKLQVNRLGVIERVFL